MLSRTLYIKCSFVCLNFVLFRIIRITWFCCVFCFFRFIQFVLLYHKQNKGTFKSLQKSIKKFSIRSGLLSSREHPRVFLCCSEPTFMLFHSSLFFLILKYHVRTMSLHLKLSLLFKISIFDARRCLSCQYPITELAPLS